MRSAKTYATATSRAAEAESRTSNEKVPAVKTGTFPRLDGSKCTSNRERIPREGVPSEGWLTLRVKEPPSLQKLARRRPFLVPSE